MQNYLLDHPELVRLSSWVREIDKLELDWNLVYAKDRKGIELTVRWVCWDENRREWGLLEWSIVRSVGLDGHSLSGRRGVSNWSQESLEWRRVEVNANSHSLIYLNWRFLILILSRYLHLINNIKDHHSKNITNASSRSFSDIQSPVLFPIPASWDARYVDLFITSSKCSTSHSTD